MKHVFEHYNSGPNLYDPQLVKNYLKRNHKKLGQGACSSVFDLDENSVIKFNSEPDLTLNYLEICKEYQEKGIAYDWMIKVEMLQIVRSDMGHILYYTAILEKLIPYKNLRHEVGDIYFYKDEVKEELEQIINNKYPFIRSHKFVNDTHDGNFMIRKKDGKNTIVLTDPSCGDYPLITCFQEELDYGPLADTRADYSSGYNKAVNQKMSGKIQNQLSLPITNYRRETVPPSNSVLQSSEPHPVSLL